MMIAAGDNKLFSIAAEVTETPEGWLLGRFRFVLHGRACGNWDDESDLRGCYGWLKDFVEKPRRRFEPGLLDLPASDVYDRLVRPVANLPDKIRMPELYENTYNRFHISHLGMSSFNRVDMVLIEGAEIQRCVWMQNDSGNIHDDVFPARHIQHIAKAFCGMLKGEAATLGVSLD